MTNKETVNRNIGLSFDLVKQIVEDPTIRNGEKINQASWLLLLSLFFTLKTVIIST